MKHIGIVIMIVVAGCVGTPRALQPPWPDLGPRSMTTQEKEAIKERGPADPVGEVRRILSPYNAVVERIDVTEERDIGIRGVIVQVAIRCGPADWLRYTFLFDDASGRVWVCGGGVGWRLAGGPSSSMMART